MYRAAFSLGGSGGRGDGAGAALATWRIGVHQPGPSPIGLGGDVLAPAIFRDIVVLAVLHQERRDGRRGDGVF